MATTREAATDAGGDDESALRAAVDAWLRDRWDPDLLVDDWWAVAAEAGWTAPHFPAEWGGRGASRRSQSVVRNAFREHEPSTDRGIPFRDVPRNAGGQGQ